MLAAVVVAALRKVTPVATAAGLSLSHHKRIGGSGTGVDPHTFGLHVFADGINAVFAAQARMLVAAKRRHIANGAVSIYPYRPRLNPLGHTEGPADITRPHAGPQTEVQIGRASC